MGRQFNLVSEQEEIEFIKEAEIQRLKDVKKLLKEINETTGQDVSKQEEIVDQIISGLERAQTKIKEIPPLSETILSEKSVQAMQKRLESLKGLIRPLTIDEQNEKDRLEKTINGLIGNLQIDSPKVEIQIERPNLDPLVKGILDDLRELAAEVGKVIGNIGPPMLDAFHLIQNIVTDTLKQQIDATQQLLDERTQQRETLESELSKELDYQARGLANNVGNKQAEVDALLEEETKYQDELRVLKDKEAKAQKRIESIAQAEAFITTAVNLYKGFSFLGPAGIPLGLAAVGAFTAWFAKIKADARRDTRLFKGAERISDHFGYAAKNGESDIPGRGQGFAVVSNRTGRRTGVTISGKEMILPEKYSMTNSEFFHNMKKGMYDGVDLVQAIDVFKHYNTNDNKQIITKTVMGKQGNSGTWMPFEDKKGRKGAVYMEIKANRSHGDIIYYE